MSILPHHFHELTIWDLAEGWQQHPLLSWVHLNREMQRSVYSEETSRNLMDSSVFFFRSFFNHLHEIYSCRRSNSSGESLVQSNRFMDNRQANICHRSFDDQIFDIFFLQQIRVRICCFVFVRTNKKKEDF